MRVRSVVLLLQIFVVLVLQSRVGLRGTDTVAKLSPLTRATRRLSDGHVEGIEAVRHRDDAVDAT